MLYHLRSQLHMIPRTAAEGQVGGAQNISISGGYGNGIPHGTYHSTSSGKGLAGSVDSRDARQWESL